ncbi:hypothetical protein J4G33_04905 [Actinotalea sp. BY-33]|uniref:Uncharacterized protein n=1 Tax=Actinotalea soli TaxID=2819234 RepID=A0A939LNZ9_9CELL|nr:hypothetical protein [Actinotalea soli]MBO1751138.1 hypothetical protein [Actinotalea soli]
MDMNPVAPLPAVLAAQAATTPTTVTARWVRDGLQVINGGTGALGSAADARALLSGLPTQVR